MTEHVTPERALETLKQALTRDFVGVENGGLVALATITAKTKTRRITIACHARGEDGIPHFCCATPDTWDLDGCEVLGPAGNPHEVAGIIKRKLEAA